jgi:hypothetical protein
MAITFTPAEFKVRFPEFATVDDALIQTQLDRAEKLLIESVWGDCYYEDGVYLLAAHFLAVQQNRAASAGSSGSLGTFGSVISRSVGDVSVTFGRRPVASTAEEFYTSTPYGQEYWAMLRQVGTGAVAVGWVS